jgi:iron complex outermembrane recepter protein
MKRRDRTSNLAKHSHLISVQLTGAIGIIGLAAVMPIQPTWANEEGEAFFVNRRSSLEQPGGQELNDQELNDQEAITRVPVLQLDDFDQPAITIDEWMAQIAQAQVRVTGVRVTATETGVEVVLATSEPLETPTPEIVGNALIADIPTAVLDLPEGEEFQAANPAAGIALVSVTSLPSDRVRVAITGLQAPPVAEVRTEAQGLVLSITPGAEGVGTDEEAIQVVVTGEQEDGYAVDSATTATRTETPLRDIPQSIQVIPQQVLEDQQARDLNEALRNVSGVYQGNTFNNTRDDFILRGFSTLGFRSQIFRDGFRTSGRGFAQTSNIERLEVLRGPASVLFGALEPGGIINLVSEQPLAEPYFAAELDVGSYTFLRPSIDLSGPLNADRTVLYRLNAEYTYEDGFRDFEQDVSRIFLSPVIRWQIGDRTAFTAELEYLDEERPFDSGLPAIGTEVADIPRDRILGEPNDIAENEELRLRYLLEHEFNDRLTLRNTFRYLSADTFDYAFRPGTADPETGILSRDIRSNDDYVESYSMQTNLIGEFTTGPLEHTLLLGVDLERQTVQGTNRGDTAPGINIFDPVYDQIDRPSRDDLPLLNRDEQNRLDSLGIYLQNQITILDNLKLLIGGRFDIADRQNLNFVADSSTDAYNDAFSPRIGIVYQPIEPLSLYASYSQGFVPSLFTDENGALLEPERGTQYEIGARGELFDGGLIINLAAYEITKTNVATFDPVEFFAIPLGEVRSRGIELDVIGELTDGWNIVASYAYTDAEITEDLDPNLVGRRVGQVPEHGASLWTTYELQQGNLRGLGVGLGVFFVGDRVDGTFDPVVELPSYVRTDAALFYRRNNWDVALNFKNVFDVDYIQSGFYNPGAPFTVIGSVSVQF